MNANNAIQTIENEEPKVFYPENNGREGFFVWLISLSFLFFGPAAWSLRLVSALIGAVTIIGIYFFTKELLYLKPNKLTVIPGWFKVISKAKIETRKIIAVLASFFTTISFWHINFSRIGFRGILVPFLMVFSFYFLLKAFRTKKASSYIFAGIFFGLGFYTYIAFRLAVLILAVLLISKLIEYWKKKKPFKSKLNWKAWLKKIYIRDNWWKVDLFLLVIFLVALPIGLHFLDNPQDFSGRAGGVSVFSQENPIKALTISTGQTLGMFNFIGDGNWRHNLAGEPMLFWPIGILFLIGIILIAEALIIHCFKSIKFSEIKISPTHSILLISWFLVMLLPATLTTEGIPHALRTIGVIPIVYIFVAIGFYWLVEKLYDAKIRSTSFLALIIILSVFVLSPIITFNKYFSEWGKSPHTEGAFRQDLVDLAKKIKLIHKNKIYVIANEPGVPVPYPNGLPMPTQTLIFYDKAYDLNINFIKEENIQKIKENNSIIIIPLVLNKDLTKNLHKNWPNGNIKQITNKFKAYEIN